MKKNLSREDEARLKSLQKIRKENLRILQLYSRYLNLTPRFITEEMVTSLAKECNVQTSTAFSTLFSAACGLDTSKKDDERMEKNYILPGLHRLSTEPFCRDAYCQTIRFPGVSVGKWSFKTEEFLPFEPFVCNDPVLSPDFREIPQIGYFESTYSFPSVLENGVEWMTVTPNEVKTMEKPIEEANGNVLTLGLGLGYFLFHASNKENVKKVTVVERDSDLIEMFKKHLLPQFPHAEKVEIVHSDAFDYLEKNLCPSAFDFVFSDLWHDPSDGLSLYLRLKKYERLAPATKYSYWIEPTLLSYLRGMVMDEILSPDENGGNAEIRTYTQIEELLSASSLSKMAPKIKEI